MSTTLSYGMTPKNFQSLPVSTTNANKQTTSYTYDALGRVTGETLPGETTGDLTKQWVYTDWCSGTAAQSPCLEIDEIDRLNSSTTVTTRAFYDGEGRLVETRAPGPAGQDVVTYKYYDSSGRSIFKSNPYFVTAYTGTPGSAAYSIPDSTQPGSSTAYPTLRQTSVTDPNSHTSTTTASVICGVSGTSDTGCYAQGMVLDANGHESATLTGGLGKTNYQQLYTGNSTYTLYSTTIKTYDAAGELLSTVAPDGSTTATSVYDALGRKTSQTDPDSGKTTATYDPNGNLLESVDARGSAGTVFAGYDGLNRPLWRNSTNSSSGAWVTYTYDSTANGNQGVGELTGETFSGSGGLSSAYAYTYDARGQQVGETVTVNGTNYPVQATYNDDGQVISHTYPTGEVVTSGYSSTGWLSGLTTSLNSVNTTLANNLSYSGLAGAAGHITAMSVGSTYNYAASFDTGMRLTSASLTNSSTSALLYQTQPAYDAVNNVVSVQTSVSGQTDTQQFCYDDLYRLTWAGTNGTPPCSGTAITAGTLTSAQYQQSDSYDVDGRLTSGPGGSYTYGDNSHPHAVTSTSKGYSAAYDAAGNMTCRALTTATTCSGTPTAQQLGYDAEGRLSSWQNQPTSPAQAANYLYDGSGNRVAMQSTVNGTTTLTAYIGSIEEVQTTGSTTQTTTYYTVGGERIAANVNGTFYYFGYDALGSQVVVLNSSGSVSGAQLYGPYGSSRYSTGTLPTSIGFTGQLNDSVTGLDYYIARYYDPAVGVFLSVDSLQGNAQGMNPYAYVAGNPETETDPTGERIADMNGDTAYVAPAGNNQWKLTSYTSTSSYWATMSYTYVIGRHFHRTSPISYTRHYYPTHKNVPVVHHPTHSSRGTSLWHNVAGVATTLLDLATGISSMRHDYQVLDDKHASVGAQLWAVGDLAFNGISDVLMFTGAGELIRGGTILEHLGADELGHLGEQALADCGLGLSFIAATRVATAQGERAIGSLHPADKVWAYNPKTHKMELQPILHVWINHDHDLVDLTLTTTTKAQHGKTALRTSETIHTNQKHPFLTAEKGFVTVGHLRVGMHIVRAGGGVGVITGWKLVPGVMTMYNLEVAQDHTFTVGDGQWVVHNCGIGQGYHKEVYAPRPVKASEVTDQWDKFLGDGPYSNTHPRTGVPDANRLVSADGTRSIRFGPHEMNSRPTNFHYHEETWTYDPANNVMNVDNTLVRIIP
jgi:RHS repeat-associated protein